MIDELILHIGMPKTGTTSIQRALNAVRGGDDWTYLDLNPPHSANPVILRAYGGVTPVMGHAGPRGARSPKTARDHITRALKAVRTPRALLSAEAMVRLPPAAVADLLAHLSEHARHIRAVAYIRPPYSFMTSYVQQTYKTGFMSLPDAIHRAARSIPADMSLWEHALGADQVTLFPYRFADFPHASVVQHFAEALSLGPLPEQPRNANVSLGDEATRLLYQFRKYNPDRNPADGRILFSLAQLGGERFRLHPDCLADLRPMIDATRNWAERRMAWAMDEQEPMPHPRAIARDEDLDDILPETLDWLAVETGRPAHCLRGDPHGIADAVGSLRHQPARLGPFEKMVRRLRLA